MSSTVSASVRQINIDLGTPLIEVTQSVTTSRLNEAVRVMIANLNNHEQLIQLLLSRTNDMEKKQEVMQRELNRIAPQAGASSAELLEQMLELKRDLTNLSQRTADQNRDISTALGDRLTIAEDAIKSTTEQRTRDLIARDKDFTQLTTDMQKLSARLNALVIPDVQPLESAQKSLTKRMDEADKLLVFASSFAAVWDADTARVEALQRAPTDEKVEYVHSLPPMKTLRSQVLQELRVQAVERLEMLTHELRDKVDLHKLTDLLGAVDEQLNELRVEDGRQERRLVSLEQGPLRISSIEDTLRRLQQSKADVSSLDLKADLAALQGLLQSINTIQDDINDLYDRVPRGSHAGGGGGGGGGSAEDPKSKSSRDKVSFHGSSFSNSGGRPSQSMHAIPQMPTAASTGGGGTSGAAAGGVMKPAADQAAVNALERRVTETEMQIKRLDDLKANRSELLRLHEYLDSKLQNFSALTSSAVAQANAAANAASRTLEAAAKKDAISQGIKNNGNIVNANDELASTSLTDQTHQQQHHPTIMSSSPHRGSTTPLGAGYRPGNASNIVRQPAPPSSQHFSHANTNDDGAGTHNSLRGNLMMNRSGRTQGGSHSSPWNQSVFSGSGASGGGRGGSPAHRQLQQGLNIDGHNPLIIGDDPNASSMLGGAAGADGKSNVSPTIRRSPLPTARIGNSWHIGRSSVAVRDSGGACIASASLVPKFDESTMNEKERARSRSNSLQPHSHDMPSSRDANNAASQ